MNSESISDLVPHGSNRLLPGAHAALTLYRPTNSFQKMSRKVLFGGAKKGDYDT